MPNYSQTRERQTDLVRSFENRAMIALEKRAPSGGGLGAQLAGPAGGWGGIFDVGSARVTRNKEAYAYFRNWVYICVDAIACRLAGQPICAGEITNADPNPDPSGEERTVPTRKAGLPRYIRETIPKSILKSIGTQNLEVYESHPVLDLFARPNPVQKGFEFFYLSAVNLLLTGESYWIGSVGDAGEPEIWAVPTHWLEPEHDGGLFTGYKIKLGNMAVAQPIPVESVARTYFADPMDLKSAFSPVRAALGAIRTDDYIQSSQEQMFERGINPNLIVTVGKVRRADGTLSDRRPVMGGAARRQMIRAIREIWNQTVSAGDPAILDGLIESVHKLHNTPQEMDWPSSSEIVKKRIMQTYKVNPIVVGEITAGNRAQAVEAEKNFCGNAVNPIGSALSETATDFVGPWFEENKRTAVWVEECVPTDPDLDLKRWTEARRNEDVTTDEFRAEILGIPPLEVEEESGPSKLLSEQGGLYGITSLLEKIANGYVSPEQGSATLQATLRLPAETADMICGVGNPDWQPFDPTPDEPDEQPTDDEPDDEIEPAGDGEPPPDDIDTDDGDDAETAYQNAMKSPVFADVANMRFESGREFIAAMVQKNTAKIERRLGHALTQHFRRSIRNCTAKIAKMNPDPDPDNAEVQAAALVAATFDFDKAFEDLVESTAPHLAAGFADGVFSELSLLAAVNDAEKQFGDKTTAEDIVAQLDIDVPPDIPIGQAPAWFRQSAESFLYETFAQPYWTSVDETTADQILDLLADGINDGHSVRRIAGAINSALGTSYSMARATNVVRTELTGAMNAGHETGIDQTASETGLPIGKEWVSVMGNTTRATHAAMDGQQTVTPDGLFELAGVNIPYPGHVRLPAGERCNCQCTIISSLVMDAMNEAIETGEPELAHATLDKMEAKDIIATHPGLDRKQKAMMEVKTKMADRQHRYQKRVNALRSEYATVGNDIFLLTEEADALSAEIDAIVAEELSGNEISDETRQRQMELNQKIAALDRQIGELHDSRAAVRRKITRLEARRGKLADKQREMAIRALGVKTSERIEIKPEQVRDKSLSNWKKRGKKRSMGRFGKDQKSRIGKAKDFLSRMLTRRKDFNLETLQKIEHVRVHAASKHARAWSAVEKHYPNDPRKRGISCATNAEISTYVHEMGHQLENSVPGLEKRANEFKRYRIQKSGRSNRKMVEVFPGYGYTQDEIGNDDDFHAAFDRDWKPGKTYPPHAEYGSNSSYTERSAANSAFYTGKNYTHGSTEVLSMGFELLYEDPVGFAERDPEFFKFIVGVLDGTIR